LPARQHYNKKKKIKQYLNEKFFNRFENLLANAESMCYNQKAV